MTLHTLTTFPVNEQGAEWIKLKRQWDESAARMNRNLPLVYNVKGFGAAGKGLADDTAPLRLTIDQAVLSANANGAEVYHPPGTYYITGNPFYNRIASGNVPLLVNLSAAKWLTTKQIKLPASTILRGSNRLRCGIFADAAFIPSVTISSIALVSNVVTVMTSSAHGLESNATVAIQGVVTETSFNGGWILSTVPTPTTFTFAFTHANISDTTGTVYIPLVVLGDNATNTAGVRLENLQVNGADLVDSIGVYSNAMGELCGGDNILIVQTYKYGLWLERHGTSASTGGPNNYRFENFEVSVTPDVGATCIRIRGLYGLHRGLDHFTCNTSTNAGTMAAGLDISGAPGLYSRCHFEHCTDGILIGDRGEAQQAANGRDSAGVTVVGATGHSSVTTLVRLNNAGEMHDICLSGLTKAAGTNILVDEVAGLTLTDHYLALYAIGGVPTSTRISTSPNVPWLLASTIGDLHVTGTATVDGQLSASGTRFIVDATTSKVTLDGVDGLVAAGSVGYAETGGSFVVSARGDVYVLIDNDASGAGNFFGVYSNLTAASGTPLLRVSETTGITGAHYNSLIDTPSQIVANQDDYDPGIFGWLRLSTDASRNITGFTNGVEGRELWLTNIGSFNIVLVEQATSTAANQIITGTGANVTVVPLDSVLLKYDSTSSRWRIMA